MNATWQEIDQFDGEVIDRLRRETFCGDVCWREEVDSTNDWAIADLRDASADQRETWPRLYLCELQRAGRGRGSNRWWAATGTLAFTLVARPPADRLPQARWPLLSLAIGVAIADAVQAVTGSALAQLKWPNDVYLGGSKAAGVLIEAAPERRDLIVIGVGINVSCDLSDAPADIRNSAASIFEASGRYVSRPHMLFESLRRIEQAIDLVAGDDPQLIDRANALHLLNGRSIKLQLPKETISGKVERIEPDGSLLLQTEQGPRRFHSGTVVAGT